MQNTNPNQLDTGIETLVNELQTIRQEINELKSMTEKLGLQEKKNYDQLAAMQGKPNDLNEMAAGEQQAAILLTQMRDLCNHMNQHIATIGRHLQIQNGYPTQSPMHPPAQYPMPDNMLPQGFAQNANLNEFRPDPQFVRYPYNRFTT
ncbi:hypothetical protein [Effusibacillus lacus]|uniref:Uncharacterized protein n=1 Tax=Effusibacillus lacus TaxID=1348429 RepID=A0A292YG59_9BACL|nr:hypothetical protein [Effusibacillus lacus]TCS70806.1 hypothetical protein EDD64_13037 [Effusibacillus lacus]GAX89397.1 hypothetical protein EFBL_1015 [Effusibacillus lacus]